MDTGANRVILGKGSVSKRTHAVQIHIAQGQLYTEGRLCDLYGGDGQLLGAQAPPSQALGPNGLEKAL